MAASRDWERLAGFVRERRTDLGMTQEDARAAGGPSTATMRLIEGALQESYQPSTLRDLEKVLRWERGSAAQILAGGDPVPLGGEPEPLPEPGHHARHRAPEAPAAQWLPPLPDSATIERARPHADAIWQRLRQLALQGIADPSGELMFPGDEADAADWDRRAGLLSLEERVWLIAAIRAREEARERGQGMGTGLSAGP